MGNTVRVAILTGNELRHRFYAATLSNSAQLEVELVVFEEKANTFKKMVFSDEGQTVIDKHFEGRTASEEFYFSKLPVLRANQTLEVEHGGVNEPPVKALLKELELDFLLIFGSSIIDNEILHMYPNKVINLHLGLSPYYRGSGTLFWPLVDGLPECVGGTIHLAVEKIDAGDVLKQVRPTYAVNDMPHDLGNKTILACAEALPDVLIAYHNGQLVPKPIRIKEGKLCLRKDLTAESVTRLYQNFEAGMMREFLDNADTRLAKYPII